MENSTSFSALSIEPTNCAECKNSVSLSEIFCSNCGFPANGTPDQKSYFYTQRMKKREELQVAKKNITWAIGILGFMAILNLVFALAWLGFSDNREDLIGDIIACGISSILYGGLCIWSYYKPFPAILSGFILYLMIILLQAIDNPITLLSGVIFKVLIISAFIKAIVSAKKSAKIEKDLGYSK